METKNVQASWWFAQVFVLCSGARQHNRTSLRRGLFLMLVCHVSALNAAVIAPPLCQQEAQSSVFAH